MTLSNQAQAAAQVTTFLAEMELLCDIVRALRELPPERREEFVRELCEELQRQ